MGWKPAAQRNRFDHRATAAAFVEACGDRNRGVGGSGANGCWVKGKGPFSYVYSRRTTGPFGFFHGSAPKGPARPSRRQRCPGRTGTSRSAKKNPSDIGRRHVSKALPRTRGALMFDSVESRRLPADARAVRFQVKNFPPEAFGGKV